MAITDTLAHVPTLDQDQIEVLRTATDDPVALMEELLELFVGETAPRLQGLGEAIAESDSHRASQMVHAMAGSAANLGGRRLATLCRTYESSFKEEAVGPEEDPVSLIKSEYDEFVTAFRGEIRA